MFEKVDAVIVKTPDASFFYFTGLEGTWESSYAIVFPDAVEVVAPPLERGRAHFYTSRKEMEALLKELATAEKIGFNSRGLSHADYLYLKKIIGGKWIDVGKEIMEARVVKRKSEVALIRRACRETKRIMDSLSLESKSEAEVAAEAEYEMRKRGMKAAFDTIVAFGKNSSSPHHTAGKKSYAMPAILDMGARYRNYCSDITRTFVERRGRKIYEIVEEALNIAIDEMVEGVKASEVVKKVEDFLKKHGRGMRHSLGHSIGIEVHDGFSLSSASNFILKENMVFAVEPAIYTAGMGVRIEEDVIVKKGKAEIIR